MSKDDDLADAFLFGLAQNAKILAQEEAARRREQWYGGGRAQGKSDELGNRAVIRYMATVRLKRGQMLLLEPGAVTSLMVPGRGLPDPRQVHILDNKPGA